MHSVDAAQLTSNTQSFWVTSVLISSLVHDSMILFVLSLNLAIPFTSRIRIVKVLPEWQVQFPLVMMKTQFQCLLQRLPLEVGKDHHELQSHLLMLLTLVKAKLQEEGGGEEAGVPIT